MALVDTRTGKVEGIEKGGVLQFRGIPFAAPPVGDRRWHPPRPHEAWADVWAADRFRPAAPQARNPLSLLPGPESLETSEDCLYLNVFTASTGGDPKPVMLWVHGGGFTSGSGSNAWYNGTSFARNGAVVVTVNYRLGALGFLDLGEGFPGSGNCGLLDQVAALEWVRDNIAAFGGDPGNVTVFGESAGGMSVGSLMGMPAAAGLFHKAILQSGAASNVHSRERAAEVADRMKVELGGLDGLRAAPAERIVEAQMELQAEIARGAGIGLAFQPSVDGAVLPRQPLDAVRSGSAASVATLTGTNRDEMTIFLAAAPAFEQATEDQVVGRLDRIQPGTGRSLYDAYHSVLGPGATPRDVWVAVETDRVFRMPAIRLAEAQLEHTHDVWMYLFTWESPLLGGRLKSCHALEIPFVWRSLSVRGTDLFAGAGPEADALAGAMHGAWSAFAASGDTGWDRYDATRRPTRVFGPGDRVVSDPMGKRRRLWGE